MMVAEAIRAGVPALFLAVLAVSGGGAGPALQDASHAQAATPGFQVFHYASPIEGIGFRERFIVDAVDGGLVVPTAQVRIDRDGLPLAVDWQDPDGILNVGDEFSFVQEAFDQKQRLTGHVAGVQVMECRFGGGAGEGLKPQEWRELGMPEEVRCLQLTDDQ